MMKLLEQSFGIYINFIVGYQFSCILNDFLIKIFNSFVFFNNLIIEIYLQKQEEGEDVIFKDI